MCRMGRKLGWSIMIVGIIHFEINHMEFMLKTCSEMERWPVLKTTCNSSRPKAVRSTYIRQLASCLTAPGDPVPSLASEATHTQKYMHRHISSLLKSLINTCTSILKDWSYKNNCFCLLAMDSKLF